MHVLQHGPCVLRVLAAVNDLWNQTGPKTGLEERDVQVPWVQADWWYGRDNSHYVGCSEVGNDTTEMFRKFELCKSASVRVLSSLWL